MPTLEKRMYSSDHFDRSFQDFSRRERSVHLMTDGKLYLIEVKRGFASNFM